MAKNQFYLPGTLIVPLLFLISTSLKAQVGHSTIAYGPPHTVSFTERAAYEKAHPLALAKRAVEQGEDRFHLKPKPQPVPADAVVSKVKVKPAVAPRAGTAAPNDSPFPDVNINGVMDNGTLIPPDLSVAAGRKHVMVVTNQEFRIYFKDGNPYGMASIPTFFASTRGSNYFDPRIAYDPNNDRFIISMDGNMPNGDGGLFLAVSQTGDPTGNWYVYSFDANHSNNPNNFLDYPQLGFSNNWVVLSANEILYGVRGVGKVYVFNRAGLYGGTEGTVNSFTDSTAALMSPATTYDVSQNTEYLVSEWNGNSGGNGYVRLSTITGTASSPVYAIGSTIGVNRPWSMLLTGAYQNGGNGGIEIDAGDTRMHSCIYRNGSLWFTHRVSLPETFPSHMGVDWWQVNPGVPSVTQFGRIEDTSSNNTAFYYYPSLAVNAKGDMLIGYNYSCAGCFVSSAYAIRMASDPAGVLARSWTLQSGVDYYVKTLTGDRNRWGDYSGTVVDPSDNSFWTFQEWANSGNNWATQLGHVPDSEIVWACQTPAIPSPGGLTGISDTSATFNWITAGGVPYYTVRYRPTGTPAWTTRTSTTGSFTATGLTPGTDYEWQVQTTCSDFTSSTYFNTTGGCPPPQGLSAGPADTGVDLYWAVDTGAVNYIVEWRAATDTNWNGKFAYGYNNTIAYVNGLIPDTKYYFRVLATCDSGNSNSPYSVVDSFTTIAPYPCWPRGNANNEYIKTVALNTIYNTVPYGNGYSSFTNIQTSLAAGSRDTITLTPGFYGSSYQESWTVYIDYDQDNQFDEAGEIVATGTSSGTIPLVFTIPATAKSGPATIRIQMHRGSIITDACATLDYGDVQDYTVVITGGATAPVKAATAEPAVITGKTVKLPEEAVGLKVVPNPLPGVVAPTAVYTLAKEGNVSLKVVDLNGRVIYKAYPGIQGAGQHSYLLNIPGGRQASGYYILVLEQGNKIIARTKFIVQ